MPLTRCGREIAAAVGIVVSGACAGGAPVAESAPSALPGPPLALTRVVAPFDVVDSAGRRLEIPFFGGLSAPRPQLLDVDGDGLLDLFVQDASGRVALFERQAGDGLSPRFRLRTDRYAGLDVGEWYRFADVDVDGDLDLLTEQPFSYIRYYRNDGGPGSPRFTLAADTLRDVDGRPIFADAQNIPQLGDLDCNGRADLLIGRLDGTVSRYEAATLDGAGVPRFALLAPEFEGIRITGQGQMPGGGGSRHGANTMALADYDADGDLDLFWGDFFEPGLLLIENSGSCPAPAFRAPPVQFPPQDPVLTSGYNAPTFGDVDGDGRLDLVMGVLGGAYNPNRTTVGNLYYLTRSAANGWTVRAHALLPILDVGSESIPALADLDGDGDLDLLLANKLDPDRLTTSLVYAFENVGTPTAPALRGRGALPLAGRYHFAPAVGDLDDDGRPDLLLGQFGAAVSWHRGTGPGAFALFDSAVVTITRGSNTVPTLGDLDGDGDLDLLVGEASGWLNYYRNDGTPAAPAFALVSDEWAGIRVGRRSAPLLADLDGDGDLDLLVGAEQGVLALFRNQGTRQAARFVRDATFVLEVPALAAPATGDLDGDGDLDLVVGGIGGGLVYFAGGR